MDNLQPTSLFIGSRIKGLLWTLLLCVLCFSLEAQTKAFDSKLKTLLSFSVPTISVDSFHKIIEASQDLQIYDIRSRAEYDVSHIPGAQLMSYKGFNIKSVEHLDRDKPIFLYCSVGYRSEKIGEKLLKAGFSQVHNVYGGFFEWANQSYPMVDKTASETSSIHGYNERWSKWVENPELEVTW